MDIKVSVIIPIYNCEKYLKQCLESVKQQTLKDIQVILVDDGSTDRSAEICQEYVRGCSLFEYYHKENGGSASARNVGLKNAKGEYVGFVDSDDWVESDMFEKMYRCAKDNRDTDMVFCRVFESETPGAGEYIMPREGLYNRKQMKKKLFPYLLPSVTSNGTFRNIRWSNVLRLFRREVIEENNIRFCEKSRRCEDLGFSFACTINSNSYYVLDRALYHNRPNPESKSRNYSRNMWKSIRELILYLQEISNTVEDYDFNRAMDFCIFFFCTTVVRNEMRLKEKDVRNKNISELLNDPLCKEPMSRISSEGMNEEYSTIFSLIKAGNTNRLAKYMEKLEFRKKYLYRFSNIIFSNPYVKGLYLKIRKKSK